MAPYAGFGVLNSSLYLHVVSSITDKSLRTAVEREGDLVRLLLNLRYRFGNNAGVACIQLAEQRAVLRQFSDPQLCADQVQVWVEYMRETDPNVLMFSQVMSRLHEFAMKQSDGNAKQQLLNIYSMELPEFGRDPVRNLKHLLEKIQAERNEFCRKQQN